MSNQQMEKKCPPSLFLEGFAVESLDETLTASIARHLEHCSECQQKLVQISREKEAFLSLNPATRIAAVIPEKDKMHFLKFASLRVAPVCILILIAFVLLLPQDQSDNYFGIKGSFSMNLYVTRNNDTFIGKSGFYFPGDQIQFSVLADSPVFLYIVNIDDHDKITFYFPTTDVEQEPLLIRQKEFLPLSITLDQYIGNERIFVFVSQTPFTFQFIRDKILSKTQGVPIEAIDHIAGLGQYQESFLIQKKALAR
ncbi:DUF4384 domain-containing protein [candidate division CSSED10-310 bacterium]|uniref:DUF4384 domain-containing protein n=1 Tax=candidate division CSSED10-310 bacterium TaxID=2855610 RepID=A0ABV6Z145_UNCC1